VLLLLTGFLLATIGGLLSEVGAAHALLVVGPGIFCLVAGFVRLLYAYLLEDNRKGHAGLLVTSRAGSLLPEDNHTIYEAGNHSGYDQKKSLQK
jgi:hypothetical protein